jgi:methyltransferase
MIVYWVLLGVIACERIAELVVSARHAKDLLRRGGVEYGFGHFPAMIALHVALIAGCVLEPLLAHRTFAPGLGAAMVTLTVLANGLRWWCIRTLGPRWTARVIVLPGAPLVRVGPYRWFSHPNYVAVIIEGFALPLAGSAWITAAAFTMLNAVLLTVRIRCETRALAAGLSGGSLSGGSLSGGSLPGGSLPGGSLPDGDTSGGQPAGPAAPNGTADAAAS